MQLQDTEGPRGPPPPPLPRSLWWLTSHGVRTASQVLASLECASSPGRQTSPYLVSWYEKDFVSFLPSLQPGCTRGHRISLPLPPAELLEMWLILSHPEWNNCLSQEEVSLHNHFIPPVWGPLRRGPVCRLQPAHVKVMYVCMKNAAEWLNLHETQMNTSPRHKPSWRSPLNMYSSKA